MNRANFYFNYLKDPNVPISNFTKYDRTIKAVVRLESQIGIKYD